ncbi:hypothetical protein PsYK624_042750 [Phanerochaete sordida]|uniref:Uncharacterized protein n=1 Tax=Phanerochaete sordida TaxID=48140 RepID=A0A9P3G342_9APHY|nr:hypothetical protein PsYK624_042750 [Phanerochaete sordida]
MCDAQTCVLEIFHKLQDRLRERSKWLERDPLQEIGLLIENFGVGSPGVVENSCYNCRDTLETMLHKQAKMLWNKLPEYFDLELLQL